MLFPEFFAGVEDITFAGEYFKTDNSISECPENLFEISVSSHATMFDGKAVSAICKNKSTLKCPVCLKTYNHFKNDPPSKILPDDEETLFRISLETSPLHAHIRMMEWLTQQYRNSLSSSLVGKEKENKQNEINKQYQVNIQIRLKY